MMLQIIIASFLYLIILWLAFTIVYTISITYDFILPKIKNEVIGLVAMIVLSIISLLLYVYLGFYIITKISHYFNEEFGKITLFFIVPIILGFSLLKFISKGFRQKQKEEEKNHYSDWENKNDLTKSNKLALLVMRNNILILGNILVTVINIILILTYCFDNSWLDLAINYIP